MNEVMQDRLNDIFIALKHSPYIHDEMSAIEDININDKGIIITFDDGDQVLLVPQPLSPFGLNINSKLSILGDVSSVF